MPRRKCRQCAQAKITCDPLTCYNALFSSSAESNSDSDVESVVPWPSTLPGFESDLKCIRSTCSSLSRALNRTDSYYETGWLAGAVQDVFMCLIVHLTDNYMEFPKEQSDLLIEELKIRFYRPTEVGDEPEKGALECIKPLELLDLYQLIHDAVEARHLSRPATVLTDEQREKKVDMKESMFATILDNAMIELWAIDMGDGEQHKELEDLRTGWLGERDDPDDTWVYPSWVNNPTWASVSAPMRSFVQLEPDLSPTEYKTTGEPLPMGTFSMPYRGPHPVQGTCIVCMEELRNTTDELVVARCKTGHLFHSTCLNFWVNDSAMDNANTCPHDRERICGARTRVHIGELSDESDTEDSEDNEVSEYSEASEDNETDDDADMDDDDGDDEHDSDEDAEGSDEDPFDMDIDVGDEDGAY